MSEQPFSEFAIPRRVHADVVPRYAFERALDVINGLTDAYKNAITALAEAKPGHAVELADHLVEVISNVHTAVGEALTPPR